jgi:hypothetical protein
MNPLHYQYSLTNFVVFENYAQEFFGAEIDTYHALVFSNVNHHSKKKRKKLEGEVRGIYTPKEAIKQYLTTGTGGRVYNPLSETPELYLEMNKIEFLDDETLMKFVKNYGLPYDYHIPQFERGVYSSNLFKDNAAETPIIAMDTLMFYEKLVPFKQALRLWNEIKQNEISNLKEIKDELDFYANFHDRNNNLFIKELSNEEYINYVCADLGIHGDDEREIIKEIFINNPDQIKNLALKASGESATWNKVNGYDNKKIALAYLNLKLDKLKSGRITTLFLEDRIVPAIKFKNLIEVAAYQLKKAIFTDTEPKLCLNCGAIIEQRHAHQKFCSPLPGRKRSTCENTYNQRLKRQRKKENQ